MSELRIAFRHGLGDCVQVSHLLQLYRKRGYRILLAGEDNKRWTWRFAGVDEFIKDAPHHQWGYPGGFDDLAQPDWRKNKVAHNFNRRPFPDIGEPRELWDELCRVKIDARPLIPADAKEEALRFLDGLPEPYILLHAVGSNWRSRKSLSDSIQRKLIEQLLAKTTGSVIVLDWDKRAVCPANPRVRGLLPRWGMIDQARLAALYELSHLVIGIDSGPFHFASFMDIPALGVFRSLHHCRVCLPNQNATYLVPSRFHAHWQHPERRDRWRMVEYPGPEPTADDIAEAALRILGETEVRREQKNGVQVKLAELHHAAMARIAGSYTYRRVGHDERPMTLRLDGTIGEGAAGCERTWSLSREVPHKLSIYGDYSLTCELVEGDDGVWRGRWDDHERMPIELARSNGVKPEPLPANAGLLDRLYSRLLQSKPSGAELTPEQIPEGWEYVAPFEAGYHGTAVHAGYLPQWAAIWDEVRPRRYLVVGVLLGTAESFAIRATDHHPERIVAVDVDLLDYNPERDSMTYAYRNITGAFGGRYKGELVTVRADSKLSKAHVALGPYDLIFVDGEHGTTAVLRDLDAAFSCLAEGGIILVHDIELPGDDVGIAYRQWVAEHPDVQHREVSGEHFLLGLGMVARR